MKALLIAGGLGTRLRPLTNTRPKHLLPVVNRPHIEHVFDLLEQHSIREVVLLTSYLADAFATVVERAAQSGMEVEVVHESEPLGTAGAIRNAQTAIGDGAFLALNGDVLTTADLSQLVAFHHECGGSGTIMLTPVEDPSRYGVVPTAGNGRVEGFLEKPPAGTAPTNLINAGVYVLDPSVLDDIPAGQVVSLEREVFPLLAERGVLFASPTKSYWIDIGTPQSYLEANLDALTGRFVPPGARPATQGVAIGDDSVVAGTARVSSACLGTGCIVGEGAVVHEAVLLDRVQIGDGARVMRSVLGEGAVVGPGVVVEDAALGDGQLIDR